MAQANNDSNGSSVENQEVPDWIIARRGIDMVVNDKMQEAESLFLKYPDSVVIQSGYSFSLMMDSLMSFEENKLTKAVETLKDLEKRCVTENGWLKSMTTRMFGSAPVKSPQTYATELETQIILADSQVCLAILTFLQQDFAGYFKGVWILRKAWKVYQKVYNEILTLYKENIGELHLPESRNSTILVAENLPVNPTEKDWEVPEIPTNGYIKNSSIPHSKSSNLQLLNTSDSFSSSNSRKSSQSLINDFTNMFHLKKSISINTALSNRVKDNFLGTRQNSVGKSLTFYNISSSVFPPSNLTTNKIEKHMIIRLMGAVSFGYGLFQLGVSLLPPSLIRLINIFGFGTNRENGLDCLMYARLGADMRAPLASLSLLWYHTIVRPFFAIDGTNVQAGVETAFMLLNEAEREYGQSSFFLFFKGRGYRLSSNIKNALESFQAAAARGEQREMKLLCLHEIGWCNLIELDYCAAVESFSYLKSSSRWSKAFYTYLATIGCGACGNTVSVEGLANLKQMTVNIPKGMQIDVFLIRRIQFCPADEATINSKSILFWKMLIFELLYLWNALPSCSDDNIQVIIEECRNTMPEDEPMVGLSKLLIGCSYCVQKEYSSGIAYLRECLALRKNIPPNANDTHVSAFCQFELGSLLLKDPDTKDEGISLLQQMSQYKNYDFEQKLNVRVHSLLK